MSNRLWDGTGPMLADTSAWIQARRDPKARDLLLDAIERGDICWCWPVRYELTVDAKGPDGIAAIERTLEGLREISIDRNILRKVWATMRELAADGSHGAHRYPLADLVVATAACDSAVGIVHFDQHLERLGDHLGAEAHWISRPS